MREVHAMDGRQGGRARDHGLVVGTLPAGETNGITDVPGVRVGHRTVIHGGRGEAGPVIRTGVTAILPHAGNLVRDRLYAAVSPFNGYGELTGSRVIDEAGLLGSPIVLTDTVHVGLAYDATARWLIARDPEAAREDVAIPVVGECDDAFLSDSASPGLSPDDVLAAVESARGGPVDEGCVGAGTGMQLFDFKGGIGTASRVVEVGGERYTVGVLLCTNYGRRDQLRIAGVPVGRLVRDLMPEEHREGSCIAVVATDAPLVPHQLRRLARRVDVGLARTGSVGNDGSGEIAIAFSTANRVPREAPETAWPIRVLIEDRFDAPGTFNRLFEAVADATEEAALNALFAATTMEGRAANVLHAFPAERGLEILRARGALGDGPAASPPRPAGGTADRG